ncbi:MAG TPA: pyridoxal phosphate-dependent aminotransferase [Gammaproteobacteria bacterium]|nr:pyridoxal phosphate-dependent aminotransferase [Gammaproteobacteria bacterium]
MHIPLSHKVNRIKPSATLSVASRAAELKAAGEDIIDLSIGEPDFDTPEFIKAAAIKAIHEGFTKYTPVEGTPGLKQAIIHKFSRENHLNYEPNQILVSNGAKQSFANLFTALLNPADEVIIPAPYWVSYPDMVLLADGSPVTIHTQIKQRFKISPAQLEAAITPKTRVVILNSPSNPSGMAYSETELRQLGEVLHQHPRVLIATDDIYEHILWTKEPFVNIVNACPELYERTIVINGASKAYAMTGWRIGYAAGPAQVIAAMKKVQSQVTSNANSIAQKAVEAALNGDQSCITTMKDEFKRRHDFVVEKINAIPGLECASADGAFYAFVRVENILKEEGPKTDLDFAEYLLQEAKIAVVPGSAFGTQGYMRLSYATSLEVLKQGLERLAAAVHKLQLACDV